MAQTVQQWQDIKSLRMGEELEAATPPLSFDNVTVSKPKVFLSRATQKAARVATKLARRS